ncbi:MAG: translation initiation factor IF-5A [Halobacteria archaeon]|nr:translation initiation factor IF-5A [Halobacteria archaeon]
MTVEQKQVRDIDEGGYVMIDDEPCVINSYSTSKPGKHGSAKARVEGRGVFDDQKRSFVQPVDADVQVPIIERKQGQVVSKTSEEVVQVMDLDTYETFDMKIPEDMEVEADENITFLEGMGQRRIVEE